MLATEVRGRLEELKDIANRQDANGEYLFSGYSTLTQPFASSGAHDQLLRRPGQPRAAGRARPAHRRQSLGLRCLHDRARRQRHVRHRRPAAGNTGNGVIAGGTRRRSGAVGAGDYTLRFTSATGDYEIVDSAAAVVATGTYTANGAISFNGVNISLTGMPAQNDTFSIARSRTEDIFTTLNDLVDGAGIVDGRRRPSARASTPTWARVLQQLDQAGDHCSACARRSARGCPRSTARRTTLRRSQGRARERDLGAARPRLRGSDHAHEPAAGGPAGRAGVVFADLAAVAVQLLDDSCATARGFRLSTIAAMLSSSRTAVANLP